MSRKKKRKRELPDPEEVEDQFRLRYAWLLMDEMEFQRKQRRKAIRLSKRIKKQSDRWVI